jgi:hypothetical protein
LAELSHRREASADDAVVRAHDEQEDAMNAPTSRFVTVPWFDALVRDDFAEKRYHGCIVRAYVSVFAKNSPYPWMFHVEAPDGTIRRYLGIPNTLETRAQALRRGWWRAKWVSDGTIDERYR